MLTKPAGCVLQLMTTPFAIAGLVMIMTGLSPGRSFYWLIPGIFLLALGMAPLVALGLQDRKRF